MTHRSAVFALVWLAACSSPSTWSIFQRENAHVAEGNRRLLANHAQGALTEYDLASREHPESPEVQLDRGLALLATNDLPRTREAFLRATEPPASAVTRASAYYDLGIAFYREADGKAGENDHQEAQRLFREAADAFRRSLREKPGNHDAAWNFELAIRRIREQEEEQRREQEQQNQEQQDQQQNQDQQNQQNPQQSSQDQNPQQQNPQQGSQDQNQQGQQRENAQQEPQPSNGGNQEQQAGREPAQNTRQGEVLPDHLERMLESLEDGEESLERQRARARALREGRRPAQDW